MFIEDMLDLSVRKKFIDDIVVPVFNKNVQRCHWTLRGDDEALHEQDIDSPMTKGSVRF